MEEEIFDAVIRAMTRDLKLRSYLESRTAMSWSELKDILLTHYGQRDPTDLYHSLSTAIQDPKETPQAFLMRALDLRQRLMVASEATDKGLKYTGDLIQGMFLKFLKTGLRDDQLLAKLEPSLKLGVNVEILMKEMNEISTRENERKNKLALVNKRTANVNEISHQKDVKSVESDTALVSTIEALTKTIAALATKVERVEKTNANRQQNPPRNNNYGNNQRFSRPRPACQECKDQGNPETCRHCKICGSGEHLFRSCHQKNQFGNSRGLPLGDKE